MFSFRIIRPDDAQQLPLFYYWTLYTPRASDPPPFEIVQQAPFLYYTQDWGRDGDIGFLIEEVAKRQTVAMAWFRQFYSHHAGLGFIDDQTPELIVAVHPNYRRLGLGTQLLTRLIQQAGREGFAGLSLSVHQQSPAVHFYRRHRFEQVEQRDPLCVMQLSFS